MAKLYTLPPQQLSFLKKTKEWRKKHLEWAENKAIFNYNLVRKTVLHKRINYDLLDGKLNMQDLEMILNPTQLQSAIVPDKIQHYPIINSKLNVLRGEESKRINDYRVIITNANAVSEIETNKKNALFQSIQQIIEDTSLSEEEAEIEITKLNEYYNYEWQDIREIRANALLNHYNKELSLPLKFNTGFMDALTVGEEIYQIDIVGGEPTIERINPLKIRVFQSGYSNKIEDADIIVLEDYWSLGRILDYYYDVLSTEDIKNLEQLINNPSADKDNVDDTRKAFVPLDMVGDDLNNGYFFGEELFSSFNSTNNLYADNSGNIRVLRMYWKSRRKIKKVKSYDPSTGEEVFTFYPENYILNTQLGEEEECYWINEAWEATKIGKEICVNMRPRPIQFNRMSNPSRCHFGIIGRIYNLNEQKPYSLVDMMKPYNYLYDVLHDRLNKEIANNWGRILELDLATVPSGWNVDKWFYYAKSNHLAVKDSFKEGNSGVAKGKLAGGFANNTRGSIDAELGNTIQQYMNLLSFIKLEMSEVAGISPQREGQISNRETVGGVERATLQSSHITEWFYVQHEDVKKCVYEALLETAKIALKGRKKKFQYILSDMSMQIMEIDGEDFAECDYGMLVDNSDGMQKLNSQLDMLAQAALQNQAADFSTIMKLYTNVSLAEKQRIIEKNEKAIQQRNMQNQQAEMQMREQEIQKELELRQAEISAEDLRNQRDNETKLLIAQLAKTNTEDEGIDTDNYSQKDKELLREKIREFDANLRLSQEKLALEKNKVVLDNENKQKELKIRSNSTNKTK